MEQRKVTVECAPGFERHLAFAERVCMAYGFELENFMFWSAIHLYEGDVPDWVRYPHHTMPSDFLSWTLRNNCFVRAGIYAGNIASLTDEEEVLTDEEKEELEDNERGFKGLYYEYIQSQPKEADSYERALGDILAFSETLPYSYLDGPEEEEE